jgi:hypothetical protein
LLRIAGVREPAAKPDNGDRLRALPLVLPDALLKVLYRQQRLFQR